MKLLIPISMMVNILKNSIQSTQMRMGTFMDKFKLNSKVMLTCKINPKLYLLLFKKRIKLLTQFMLTIFLKSKGTKYLLI